ncbi:hypothetical protein DYB34_002652 [Aphanomyces astaci]|uniref:Uncharacterized protein n=1 Tax=Aphanomyces astaci TaxID=112090 RepID=A0A418BVR7_APHAT|nr:hypothetical protein DYB34_002652 [Aphanomyces astaci]
MTDVLGKLTNVDLELKATARQKLREATDDAMRLREQVKQKDLLLVDNHNLHSSKELRAELEADKVQFKQKQVDWMDQIASLQLALQQSEETFQKREKEWHLEQAKQVALQSHGDTHTQHTTAALQAKLAEKTAEAATLQETLDGCTQRAAHALDQEQLKVHRLQGEKDSLSAKLTTAQELVVPYLEDDLVKLTDERTNDKQSFEKSQAHLQAQLDETLAASFNARRSLADEHKKVADKLTKSLVKAERKRDAYKEKCLQVHERYKAAAMAKEAAAVQLQQLKDQHHIEIQQFLTQWSHAEDSRLSGSMPVLCSFEEFNVPVSVCFSRRMQLDCKTVTAVSLLDAHQDSYGSFMSALRVAVALAVTTPVLSTVIGGSEPTRCTSCWQLTHCTALNGLSLPDPIVGYTRYAQYFCHNIIAFLLHTS